jgi:hypothetical protein
MIAIVMEGYDVVLLANFYAFPSFNKKYGHATGDPSNPYVISAPWQAGLSNGANVGEILGMFIALPRSDTFSDIRALKTRSRGSHGSE